ncbi:MAG: HD-GYP domain-containing protein [Methylophilaceae bacterium]
MLKRIPIEQLCVGMFLQKLEGAWIAHPFWRNAFLIKTQSEINELSASGIREVYIDTSKGVDVLAAPGKPAAQAMAAKQPENNAPEVVGVELKQELERAVRICANAKQAVKTMFHEVRMGRALNTRQAVALVTDISSSVARNPGALISLARLKNKDDYTYMHSVAVCALMVSLARQLELKPEEVHGAGLAGLLHDIGKMEIPLDIINKPGKLTDDEFAVMKGHSRAGHRLLLEGNGVAEIALEVSLHHHEKMDGSGYPNKLSGEQISLYARMGAVCDVYDAITSNRPYRNGWEPAGALRKMAEWTGHFDPVILHALIKSLGIYPIGSLVKLESGRLAVVTEQNQNSLLKPKVKVFFSTKSNLRIVPEIINLSQTGMRDKIVAIEDPAQWKFPDLEQLWSDGVITGP